ncbi:hypothetical protein TSUD_178540 [Trifolium subterraneum]|uniref:Pentacotripeptide-repeat region of PRORP domain-containing protein n=1 Tax=Trifolium subterraneum TaxID=3900 RepID=A0A2Z6NYF3_TRISU|nr:hypothetical protein TSUD_178540 [Trifolium subterraneum]
MLLLGLGYIAIGDLNQTMKIFDEMPQRKVASYNAMIHGFVKTGELSRARTVFDDMPEKTSVSFATLIADRGLYQGRMLAEGIMPNEAAF